MTELAEEAEMFQVYADRPVGAAPARSEPERGFQVLGPWNSKEEAVACMRDLPLERYGALRVVDLDNGKVVAERLPQPP